jgi:hypothetical protein
MGKLTPKEMDARPFATGCVIPADYVKEVKEIEYWKP